MELTENTKEQSPVKLKSLVAGRILSCAPFVFIALLIVGLSLSSVLCISSSRLAQICNRISLAIGGFFLILSTIPSFVCGAIGLALLIYARKKGGKRTLQFIVLSAGGMFLSALLSLFLICFWRGFESTTGQLERLSKISAIEEYVLTYDSEEGGFHDGTMYNDLDLYLTDERFLQVSHMSEYMTSFHLNAAGDWKLFVVSEGREKELIKQEWLEQEELSKLCGKKIKKLTDLISCYDTFMKKVAEMPLLEESPAKAGFYKLPLQKEKLALRENDIYEDLLRQEEVVSVKKISGHYDYLENYWYEILMEDAHTLLMTVSAVTPQDDGNLQSYFYIRSFDNEPISLLSMTNTTYGINYYSPYSSRTFAKSIGVEMKSYRDFFPNYKAFLPLTDELLEESKKAKNDKKRNMGAGMLSGVYSPQ